MDIENKIKELEESIVLTNKSIRLQAWSILANTASIGIILFNVWKLKQVL
jgi:hypothetical protein